MNERQVAQHNDERIWHMAYYHITEGLLKKVNFTDPECHKKFIEFKGLIKRGSFEINELEARVYAKFGVVAEDPDAKLVLNQPCPSKQIQMGMQELLRKIQQVPKKGDNNGQSI